MENSDTLDCTEALQAVGPNQLHKGGGDATEGVVGDPVQASELQNDAARQSYAAKLVKL